jgi:uncharacterized membrane protein YhhN
MPVVSWLPVLSVVMAVAVAAMIALELLAKDGPRWRYGVVKMFGSATFLIAAAVFRPPVAVVVGLVCCAIGDALLIPKGAKRLFAAGLAAFLCGHLAFAWGFAPPMQASMAMVLVPIVVIGVALHQWLSPHVPTKMSAPVSAYIIAILGMAWMAIAATAQQQLAASIAVAAVMFCASDVFVARERFVSPSPVNRVVGIPLYFGAQLLLASGW